MAEKEKEIYNINYDTARLLCQEPFFAALSRRVNKSPSSAIPTAGVRVDPRTDNFEMIYNPDFMGALSDDQKFGVMKHEFYHLIFNHIVSRKPTDLKYAKLWNVAADLAINGFIKSQLPENCCLPGEGDFKNLKPYQASEFYFQELKKMQQKMQNKDFGKGQFDCHEGWVGDGGNEGEASAGKGNATIAKERLRQILRKATEEAAKGGGWGTVSQEIQQYILDFINPRVNWRNMLRYFIKETQKASKFSTPRRINKRYPYLHPGKRCRRQAHVAVAIDESGSVSDELFSLFFSELNGLASLATFTVIPFDHEVITSKVFEWKKGDKKLPTRVASGGTCFNAPTIYVNERNFDGLIILTDMEAPKPVPCRCQRMWMTDIAHGEKPYFQVSKNERLVIIDK